MYTLTLNSDNTGKIVRNVTSRADVSLTETEYFNWTTSENANSVKYIDFIRTGGDDYILFDEYEDQTQASYSYILAGNTLSFGNLVFNKQ